MGTLGSHLINTGTGTAFNQKGGILLEICQERREEGQQPVHQERCKYQGQEVSY